MVIHQLVNDISGEATTPSGNNSREAMRQLAVSEPPEFTLWCRAHLKGIDPEAYQCHVLQRIATHPINCVDELLSWHVTLERHAAMSS